MSKDNLAKSGILKPLECIFCNEIENINHLFFECTVAKQIWTLASEFLSLELGTDYLSIAKFWLANNKHMALNSICACVLWNMWKFRNAFIFDNVYWHDIKQVWWQIVRTL